MYKNAGVMRMAFEEAWREERAKARALADKIRYNPILGPYRSGLPPRTLRPTLLLGPYSRTIRRVLWWS